MRYSDRLSGNGLAIFLFHGVIPRQVHRVRNYTRKHLEKAAFRTVLEDLKASGVPLSMEEVLEHCEADAPFPPGAFAVTFDDGFENNYSVAAPILDEMSIPAAFYVSTGYVDANAMSWVDRLESILENTGSGTLRLPWAAAPRPIGSDAAKIAVLDEIRRVIKGDRRQDPEALVADVTAQTGIAPVASAEGPLDRKLDWDQVRSLSRHPLFRIGGHSHAHSILSFLEGGALEKEIDLSLSLLHRKAGVGPTHYSYPEGMAHCFDGRVIACLKSRGVRICPTAMDGINVRGADPFRLRRIFVT